MGIWSTKKYYIYIYVNTKQSVHNKSIDRFPTKDVRGCHIDEVSAETLKIAILQLWPEIPVIKY